MIQAEEKAKKAAEKAEPLLDADGNAIAFETKATPVLKRPAATQASAVFVKKRKDDGDDNKKFRKKTTL